MAEHLHVVTIGRECDGWFWARCGCGWSCGPFVDLEDAAEAYGDHRSAVAKRLERAAWGG